ncbi:MAG: 5'/3'-nucleotidase SurE [Thermoguttaceae bacterium]|nr:5'/3'-nucleotidase SurE [Thermoguttaceae bacterium]
MRILLTNDDGIFSPALAILAKELKRIGEVCVVAPATEQSGVGQTITFLTPLTVKKVFLNGQQWGWAVNGSPVDCVKLGIYELAGGPVDLVVSGINNGLNIGSSIMYSGTVAAALEGVYQGKTSFAISAQYHENSVDGYFGRAAALTVDFIQKILGHSQKPGELYNINFPSMVLKKPNQAPEVCVVPVDQGIYWNKYERNCEPNGSYYYWLSGRPLPQDLHGATDMGAVYHGKVTITPLRFDMTKEKMMAEMEKWNLTHELEEARNPDSAPDADESKKCGEENKASKTDFQERPNFWLTRYVNRDS